MTERKGVDASTVLHLADDTPREEIKKRPAHPTWEHKAECQGPKCREQKDPAKHHQLDYVDARFVMDRLDFTVGPENWQDAYADLGNGSTRCGIGILIDGEWVWKWDVGTASDIEPEKGSYSDSFKRAAVKWGIARDLYGHTTHAAPSPSSGGPAAPASGAGGRPVRPSAPTVPPEPQRMHEGMDDDGPQMPPTCPVHHWAMKPSNFGGWYCGGRLEDGSRCKEKAA